MKLKTKKINYTTGHTKDVIMNIKDARKINQKAGDRIIIKQDEEDPEQKYKIAILQIAYSDNIVEPGEIGIFVDSIKNIKEGITVSVKPAEPPDSFAYIKKKIDGEKLNADEISKIINDSVSGELSQIELASFITGIAINGADNEEMTALTLAEAKSGYIFDFGPKVFDKHSTYEAISAE